MRKLSVLPGVFVVGTLLIAGCGSGTPASGRPAIPSVAIPSIAIPSIAIPSIAIPSIAIPSNLLPSSLPSIEGNADPALAARFPTTLSNAILGEVQTGRFSDVIAEFGGPQAPQQFAAAVGAAGLDPNTITYGNQMVTKDQTDVIQIQALRTPGADANRFVALWPQVGQIVQPQASPDVLGQTTIAGKTVSTLTSPSGTVDYLYVTDDVVWRISGADEETLTELFAALH